MELILVQLDVAWHDREANFDRVRRLLSDRPPHAGSLILLPEMFASGFSMDVAAIHEGDKGPTSAFLTEVADAYDACIVGGRVTRGADGRGLNEALVVAPGGRRLARYAKLHPFSFAGETEHYAAGDEIVTFEWQNVTAAPFICYDLRFPEVYRIATARGAQLLLTIANFPTSRIDHWTHLLVARAIENQAYVAGVNRTGSDPNVEYPGRSIVVDPLGRVMADGGDEEGLVVVEIDLVEMEKYRLRFPVLQDMRREFTGV